jgi:hypothetical protein
MAGHSALIAGPIALAAAIVAGEATRHGVERMGASADRARLAGTCAHGAVTLVLGLSINLAFADVAGPVTTGVQTTVSTYLYDYAVHLVTGY